MISVRISHLILVLTSTLLPLAWASYDPINLMLAVACVVFAGALVYQAKQQEPQPAPARRRTNRRDRDRRS